MAILLPAFYLPPISWFSVFLREESEVQIEQWEHFPKQTYRNRANIYGANGKLSLIVPISHNGTRVLRDIQTSDREKWQQLHWKSLKTAYQTSPYFEYYEDRLQEIFTFDSRYLLEFNLHALQVIQKLLKTQKDFTLTEEYVKEPSAEDYRNCFPAKEPSEYHTEEYYQSFSQKYGFLDDLSVLDLLCNKGPESLTYIRNVKNITD